MKKLILVIIVLAAVSVGAAGVYSRRTPTGPDVRTARVTTGDIVDAVQATGTLEAVTTVEVGTQVSGIVQELYADFNSIVKKGQVIARLDPTLLDTQIEQQRANVARSEADLERLKVGLADSKQKLQRARALSEKNLVAQTELDAAEVDVRSNDAQIRSSEAGLVQAKSQLNTAIVNKAHTVIASPIDGIVISRNVEPGQTVNAGMSAPTLFVLAADLTKMQVNANIDESDVGRMRPGERVTFRVDAFPADVFTGEVQQVRLQPTTVQNVVTYQTVIRVPNTQLKLKPGMTANVIVEVAHKSNVIRVPTSATRFRPTTEMFAALKQEVPPELARAAGAGRAAGARGNATTGSAPGVPAQSPVSTAQESGKSPAESRGGGDAAATRNGAGRVATVPTIRGNATTLDALFPPMPAVETRGTVWLYKDGRLEAQRLRLGVSDGTWTEVIDAGLQPDTEVVTNVISVKAAATPAASSTSNPLMGPQRGRGGPGGFGGPPPGR